jgi:GrpB-like predicted nucleotidyltransferase (UPF0157 family)
VNHDPDWPRQFDTLHARLWSDLSVHALALEHVGSTSVPGLAAKPIIDAAIVVKDASALPGVVADLAKHGYAHRGDLGISGREAFQPPPDTFAHHLYACVQDNLGLRNHLALREALQNSDRLVAEYGNLKRKLAERYPHDIDAYIAGKTEFILTVLRRAGFAEEDLSAISAVNV